MRTCRKAKEQRTKTLFDQLFKMTRLPSHRDHRRRAHDESAMYPRHAWIVFIVVFVAVMQVTFFGVTNASTYNNMTSLMQQNEHLARALQSVVQQTKEVVVDENKDSDDPETLYREIQARQQAQQEQRAVFRAEQEKQQAILRAEQKKQRKISEKQERERNREQIRQQRKHQEAERRQKEKDAEDVAQQNKKEAQTKKSKITEAIKDNLKQVLPEKSNQNKMETKKDTTNTKQNAPNFLLDQIDSIKNNSESQNVEPNQVTKEKKSPYLTADDFNGKSDMFAAAWWQSVERFREMQVKHIDNNPSAVWLAMNVNKMKDVRLTKDWMEFGVEHLSKYWKYTGFSRLDPGYYLLLEKLLQFIYRSMSPVSTHYETKYNPWIDTITLVSYAPIKESYAEPDDGEVFERGVMLDSIVLASQLASVMQHGAGRIIVATNAARTDHIITYVWPKVLRLLADAQTVREIPSWEVTAGWLKKNMTTYDTLLPLTITLGGTELALVPMVMEDDIRIPRRSIQELHAALFGQTPTEYARQFLGDTPSRWKYVYFTEQDSPVQTRPNVFGRFQLSLDEGRLLIPHRWQPIPHVSDLQGLPEYYYLPAIGNWTSQTIMTSAEKCCDAGKGSYKALTDYPKCEVFWYLCGYSGHAKHKKFKDKTTGEMAPATERLQRLEQYQLIRIEGGSQISLLAASEHARQCRPTLDPCD